MIPINDHNPISASKILFSTQVIDGEIYTGFKSTGFVVKKPNRMIYITAGHCFKLDGLEIPKNLNEYGIIQHSNSGGCSFAELNVTAKPIMQSGQIEADDMVFFSIKKEHEHLINGFIDHSIPIITNKSKSLKLSDQLIAVGWQINSDQIIVDPEKMIINYQPSQIPLTYNGYLNNFIHVANIDLKILHEFISFSPSFSGMSGSPVFKIEPNDTLSWSGMLIAASSDTCRFIDADFIDKRLTEFDKILASQSE